MPIPTQVVQAAAAGAQFLGGILNSGATIINNRQNLREQRRLYTQQKGDNLAFWHQQNEYNSPQAQMQRFQAAGLNPNLIYGQGNSGNATPIQAPSVQRVSTVAPRVGEGLQGAASSLINSIYDLDIKKAGLDNLRTQNTVLQQEALLKQAQTRATETSANRGQFNLDFETELRPYSAETRKESLRQLSNQATFTVNEDFRKAATFAKSMEEANERITQIKLNQAHTKQDTERIKLASASVAQDIKQKGLDNQLREMHINPNDPLWVRYVGLMLQKLYEKFN